MNEMRDFTDYIQFALENALIDVCPVDMGTLRQSISVEYDGQDLTVNMLEYGIYLDQGTGIHGPKGVPYEIKPKNKKALAFNVGNEDVVVKKVMHPGIHPHPWIRNTFYHKLPGIIQDAAAAVLGENIKVEVSFQ